MNLLIYDCEIIRGIPSRNELPMEGIEYCDGWHDHANMGVSVICAYQRGQGYRVFLEDNFGEFKELAENPDILCVGFNNRKFDDRLVSAALGITVARSWDLLREIWIEASLNPDGFSRNHGGYGLEAVSLANGLGGKSGNGALAPVLWQQGNRGAVIDYCLRDVMLTKKCIELALDGFLKCPKSGRQMSLDVFNLRRAATGAC